MTASTRRRILFVDDEPPVLNLLQTLFRHANPEWDSCFTDRGAKALALMQEEPFDVVVSDMRMPEMNGAELLEQVREHHPGTARIVLSGYADPAMSVRSLTAAHQYLAKPFTLAGLQSALDRVFAAGQRIDDPDLRRALGALHVLPTAPSLHERLAREAASPAASGERLAGLFAQDIALTAKTLQLVHSAFFGAPRPLMLARDGAQALGLSIIRSLITSGQLIRPSPAPEWAGLSLESLNRHAVAVGLRATRIMSLERASPEATKLAFTAGVLHPIGRLALATALPEQHTKILERVGNSKTPLLQAEEEILGANHAQAGAYLLGIWGLPNSLVELVANIHRPSAVPSQHFTALTALHVANHLESTAIELPEAGRSTLDEQHLRALNVDSHRYNSWAQGSQASA